MVDKHKYLFTVQIPIEAIDDADARSQAKRVKILYANSNGARIKLQQVYENKQPRKVRTWKETEQRKRVRVPKKGNQTFLKPIAK